MKFDFITLKMRCGHKEKIAFRPNLFNTKEDVIDTAKRAICFECERKLKAVPLLVTDFIITRKHRLVRYFEALKPIIIL